MTRRRLADGICSEKHVYLIEKGERSPSAVLTGLLGDRLRIDLFGFRHYLGCRDPVAVRDGIERFRLYHRSGDLAALLAATDELRLLPDFRRKPWVFEIELNNLWHLAFARRRFGDAIPGINRVLGHAAEGNSTMRIQLYALLSACYLKCGEPEKAKTAASCADRLLLECHPDVSVVVTAKSAVLAAQYVCGDYPSAVQTGEMLFKYQVEHGACERLHYTCFFLSFACCKTGSWQRAVLFFDKGMHLVYVFDRQDDLHDIRGLAGFSELAGMVSVRAVSGGGSLDCITQSAGISLAARKDRFPVTHVH